MDKVEIRITEMNKNGPLEIAQEIQKSELILMPKVNTTLELPLHLLDKDNESAVDSDQDRPHSFIVPKKKKSYAIKYRVIQIKGT
jgi:hypothetical protein